MGADPGGSRLRTRAPRRYTGSTRAPVGRRRGEGPLSTSHPQVQQPKVPASSAARTLRWWPLVAVTSANYAWQVPYALHQYGRRWDALAALSIPLILTGVWFAVAMVATIRGRPGGRTALASFLVTEVAFYAVQCERGVRGRHAAEQPGPADRLCARLRQHRGLRRLSMSRRASSACPSPARARSSTCPSQERR